MFTIIGGIKITLGNEVFEHPSDDKIVEIGGSISTRKSAMGVTPSQGDSNISIEEVT
ncbi:MAG: hypothetical protein V3R82_04840 [Candidatus Hydrothermarchaeales archaeon]